MGEKRISKRDGVGKTSPAPAFVLVEPQMGENIGAAARAMLNFGVTGMRLVNPRDGWPNPKASAMASGAAAVIDGARVFNSVEAALADCSFVVATTARHRDAMLPVLDPVKAANVLRAHVEIGGTAAVLFGGERCGLTGEDVSRANAILNIPVNPAFASINLGQAALLVAYEWARSGIDVEEEARPAGVFDSPLDDALPAPRAEFDHLLNHIYDELEEAGYFHPPEKRPAMERILRVAFTRAHLTEPEVRTLRGVVKALAKGRGKTVG